MKNRLAIMLVLVVGLTLLFSIVGMGYDADYSCSGHAPDGWVVVSEDEGAVPTICAAVNPDDDDIAEVNVDENYSGDVEAATIIFQGGKTGVITVKVYGYWAAHDIHWVKLVEDDPVRDDTVDSDLRQSGQYYDSSFSFKPIKHQDSNYEKRIELIPKTAALNGARDSGRKFYLKFKKAWF